MDLTAFYFLTTTLVLILEQEASIAAPVSDQERAPPVGIPLAPARREKRCSCENLKDKECVYFCHIGIVWVDTPGQVVPYGVGSVRLRRGVARCFCASSSDAECRRFCTPWSLQTHQDEKAFMKTSPSNLREKTDDGPSSKKNKLQVQKT